MMSGTIHLKALFNYANLPITSQITDSPSFEDDLPIDNPITNEGATLGRVLFYDNQLSLNNTTSCSSCHQQEFAFGDPNPVSLGFNGELTRRHSMRLVNARYVNEDKFFWDERALSLEDQIIQPIKDHIELGWSGTNGQPAIDSLILRMDELSYYPVLFEAAFGSSHITENRIQAAIAQFIRTIISFDSRFDLGLSQSDNLNSDFANFTDSENRGKTLFLQNRQNGGAGCQNCHRAPVFDIRDNVNNNGVITVANESGLSDLTNTRSPSLRDLVNPFGVLNGPMMHDGSFTSIRQVVDHYNDIPYNSQLDNRLLQGSNIGQKLDLTEQNKIDIEAFLRTLTGTNLYTDEKYANPFDLNERLIITGGACENISEVVKMKYLKRVFK